MSCREHERARRQSRLASAPFTIAATRSSVDLDDVRELFREYGRTPDVQECVVGFDEEIAGLPGRYAEPRGALLIARVGTKPAGCIALRPIDADAGELKRLYVRAEFRGRRIGEALAMALLDLARARGFARLRLDTLPSMTEAYALYTRLGFVDVSLENPPTRGPRDMELALASPD